MKRFLGFSLAMFFGLVAIALVGGDSGAVAGHGCHGRKCHGGMMAKHRAKKAARKAAKCHGEEVASACDSGCGESAAADSGSCGDEVVSDCGSCGGGEVVSGGCAGGDCGGEGVIVSEGAVSEGVPTEAAPVAPAAPAEPAKT